MKVLNSIPNEEIATLHATYESCTGIPLPLNHAFSREYTWGVWKSNGWTETDLRLVVAYLKRNFKDHWQKMCRFSRLIEDVSYFEEWLSLARAEKRNARPAPSARQEALADIGMQEVTPQENPNTARKVGDILKRFHPSPEQWRKAKEDAGLL